MEINDINRILINLSFLLKKEPCPVYPVSLHIPNKLGDMISDKMREYDTWCPYTSSCRLSSGVILTIDSFIPDDYMILLYSDGTTEFLEIKY